MSNAFTKRYGNGKFYPTKNEYFHRKKTFYLSNKQVLQMIDFSFNRFQDNIVDEKTCEKVFVNVLILEGFVVKCIFPNNYR